jgi:hypothetical protein
MGHQTQRVRSFGDDDPRLLLVDGFAGPGRYATGEPGSPLIMLDALLSHQSFDELASASSSSTTKAALITFAERSQDWETCQTTFPLPSNMASSRAPSPP